MIASSSSRIQTTDTQVIIELWCMDRKVSIYLDKGQNGTTAEIYRFANNKAADPQDGNPTTDFVQALEWLAQQTQA